MRQPMKQLLAQTAFGVGLMLGTAPTLATIIDSLVISEVFYDRSGPDSGFEWIEIFNGSPLTINLSGVSLGYGGKDYSSTTASLYGWVDAGEYFVLGGPRSDGTNGLPSYQLIVDFSPDLQNAGAVSDGVALFDIPQSQIKVGTIPIDAFIYGGTNDHRLLDADGRVLPPMVSDAASGASIERLSAKGWAIASSPNPGVGLLEVAALPLPGTLVLFALGLCFLPWACPKIQSNQCIL